jgi:hypothetical protein
MGPVDAALASLDATQLWYRATLLAAAAVGVLLLVKAVLFTAQFARIERGLASVPRAPGYNWLLGHVFPLTSCTKRGKGAWDMMEEWIKAKGPVVKFRILTTQGVAVCDPVSLKRIFQTGQKLYNKDLDLSYKPFLPILGSGLVTADGDLWQKQRLLIGPALRTDILDEIVPIARNATQRLIKKLELYRGTGRAVDVQKEFHLLTLQVIGEAVLSLAPEQCDRVSAIACMQPASLPRITTTVSLNHHSALYTCHTTTGVPTAVSARDGGGQQACAEALAHVPATAARVLEIPLTHGEAQHLPHHILQVCKIKSQQWASKLWGSGTNTAATESCSHTVSGSVNDSCNQFLPQLTTTVYGIY